jgi:hypothetical protein
MRRGREENRSPTFLSLARDRQSERGERKRDEHGREEGPSSLATSLSLSVSLALSFSLS